MEDIVSNPAYYGVFSRKEAMTAMEFYPDGTYLIRNSSQAGSLSLDLICCGGRFLPILFEVEEETGGITSKAAPAIQFTGGTFTSFEAFIQALNIAKYPLAQEQMLRQQSSRLEYVEERQEQHGVAFRSFAVGSSEEKNQMEGFEEAEGVMRSGGLSVPSLGREGTEEAEMIFKTQDI